MVRQPRMDCARGRPALAFRMHWDHEPVRIPLNRPPGTFSPTGGEGWDEGVRFMESPQDFDAVHTDHEPTPNPSQEGNQRDADECLLPSWEGRWVGSCKACFRFAHASDP